MNDDMINLKPHNGYLHEDNGSRVYRSQSNIKATTNKGYKILDISNEDKGFMEEQEKSKKKNNYN